MKYEEALEYLDSIKNTGIVPGLTNIENLLGKLGNPQNGFLSVQVAGTNGKGSVATFIACILNAAGIKTAKYTSPAVIDYRERYVVGGRMISKAKFAELLMIVKSACEELVKEGKNQPTVFEVETAIAFLYFNECHVKYAVVEVGMGGLLDATNIIDKCVVSVICSIGMDHMQFLGKTIEEIASHKAGIIKKGSVAAVMNQDSKVLDVIKKKAQDEGCEMVIADADKAVKKKLGIKGLSFDYGGIKGIKIPLSANYQFSNAVVAIEAINVLRARGEKISDAAVIKGFAAVKWPGRFEIVLKKPLFVIDGAHNEDAARKLMDSVEFHFTNRRIIYIMGMLRDKEYEKVVCMTAPKAEYIFTVTPPNNNRALDALSLAQTVYEYNKNVANTDSVEEAVEMAKMVAGDDGVIVAFGSLSYLGKLKEVLGNNEIKQR